MMGNSEETKSFGLDTLLEKLEKFENDIISLERDKESLRNKKKKLEQGLVGKDVK
jgi:hypothetical protein